MKIAVLEARLLFSLHELLEQMETTRDLRTGLGRQPFRSLVYKLNARLPELQADH
jgi:hypothetical protein